MEAQSGCDYKVGTPISLSITGNNTDAGFATAYVLVNASTNTIAYVTNAFPFTGVAAGQYLAYSINRDNSGSAPDLNVGNPISSIGGTCVSLSEPLPIGVCDCDNIKNSTITVQVTNQNASLTQEYLLTDGKGVILAVSSVPSFSALQDGVYNVYAINYSGTIQGAVVGSKVGAITGICKDISAPMGFVICNVPPVANSDNQTTPFNTPVTVCVLANDTDKLGNPASLTNVTVPVAGQPANGTVTAGANGCLVYTPAPGFTGTDSFTYTICDKVDPTKCSSTTVTIVVNSKAPTANPDNQTTPFNTPVTVCVLANDTDKLGNPARLTNVTTPVAGQPANGTVTAGANGCLVYTPAPGFTGTDSFTYTICDKVDPTKCSSTTVTIRVQPPGALSLLPKVYLQGALIGVYAPDTLMRDDLRSQGYVPISSPYSAWSPITTVGSTSSAVLATTGVNAIVDWVFVELRSPASFSTVIDSRAALLQRDGDIVDVDGVSPITFASASPGNYQVAVRHRNHLGVMSRTAIPLSSTTTTVDFRRPSTPTYTFTGTTSYSQVTVDQAQVIVDQGVAMWAGNAFNDGNQSAPYDYVIYQGNDNDVNVIYQQVINPPGFLVTPYTIRKGYLHGDINLDGKVIFQGTKNDVEFIYQNVIKNHPGNQLVVPFFKIREQRP
ncbi:MULTISPECIES: Ig-like domain-containing protein [unclassified Spirosoma]|uniref:Ig-like domain-containing protein n=1 Tax=unclassified Spirosoma TaxID=2621999 RepID=UPI001AC378ED|nr:MULTISPECIES: Ig-like domain-containing protein [unclassified Spirosoma]MBN8820645.1 cadherin-like domain-containing protein [Spirosoma sp.]